MLKADDETLQLLEGLPPMIPLQFVFPEALTCTIFCLSSRLSTPYLLEASSGLVRDLHRRLMC